jgi:glutamyl-Q tRNA(Asp) synthetase
LHLGHALSALLNWRRAREAGGRMLLRIEDIDTARCRAEFVEAICDDLRWLGVDWDACEVQSDHATRHAAALDRLHEMGLIFPCTCTRAEIAASASAPHGNSGPVYPGTCRGRTDAPEGAAWRLDAAKASALTGVAGGIDDIVLARRGLGVAYHLAVVIDDAAAGVTDVIRGADLLGATPVQNLLQALLGLPVPRYDHHALIAGPDGKRLAKRTPGSTLADLGVAGADPRQVREDLLAGRLPVGFGWVSP